MFCPHCGSTQNDELRFCKSCGVNLDAVREAAAIRPAVGKFDWSRTWVAEMFLSEPERKRRNEQIDRERGITPEMKRLNEIKAGVITSSVGVGLMIVLSVFMQGLINSGKVSQAAAEILSHLWIGGVLPVFIGVALIINGIFVSKKLVELSRHQGETGRDGLISDGRTPQLRSADTSEFIPPSFGVTEGTTKHLSTPSEKR